MTRNPIHLAALVSALVLSTPALADRYPEELMPSAIPAASAVSRAEVKAELQIWRESGLAALARIDGEPAASQPGYAVAQARYDFLRSGARFTELVAHFSGSNAAPPALDRSVFAAVMPAAKRTRAEVLAELAIWREAGLDPFQGEASQAQDLRAIEAAQRRYQALRNSPRFEALAQRLASK